MGEEVDVLRFDLRMDLHQILQTRRDRARWIDGNGRNLRDEDLSCLDLHADHVGESAADIDADAPTWHSFSPDFLNLVYDHVAKAIALPVPASER